MIVEDKILEYLDGSLSDRESAELLETLSLSPEKRALLEEHLRLKDLLALGKKPYTVPIETERSLAERIPILGRYNNDLLPMRWPILQRWVGARTIGLAVGAGAMIVLAGLGWYSMRGTNASGVAKSAAPMAVTSQSVSSGANNGAASQEYSSAASDISAPTSRGISSSGRYRHQAISNQGSTNGVTPAIASASDVASRESESTMDVAPVAPRESANIIPSEWTPHTLSELRLGEPKGMSPFTTGASLILDESYAPSVSTGPSGALTKVVGDATLDYDLTPNFAVGLDIGERVSSSLTNSTYILSPSSDYTRVFESPTVTSQTIYSLLLTTHLTLFPESEYQIRLGAAGGDAFGAGPMVEATAGISRVLAPNLILDLTAIGSRIWTKGSAPLMANAPNGVVGIVGQQIPLQSLYTTAFGVRAGLRIRL